VKLRARLLTVVPALAVLACAGTLAPAAAQREAAAVTGTAGGWALAIHGGAGTIPRDLPAERAAAYRDGLARALELGAAALARGAASLDVVEEVVRALEEDPLFNAGRGAVYTRVGTHELDAAIMDGRDLSAGAVAAVRTVRSPIGLARLVMTETPHVLLVGEGAEAFAAEMGVERVDNTWFDTPERHEAWQKALAAEGEDRDTVGAVARDVRGHLAAATSTGGLTNKRWGRVGDVPILGAGTYADDRTAALSATGKGEEFIRHGVTRAIAARMALTGASLEAATRALLSDVLAPGDGGVIGVDRDGELVLLFNTEGMYRGAADSAGRFEVGIWEAMEAVPRP
jgi:beta-aspartyl-peptidase (threonine type)